MGDDLSGRGRGGHMANGGPIVIAVRGNAGSTLAMLCELAECPLSRA